MFKKCIFCSVEIQIRWNWNTLYVLQYWTFLKERENQIRFQRERRLTSWWHFVTLDKTLYYNYVLCTTQSDLLRIFPSSFSERGHWPTIKSFKNSTRWEMKKTFKMTANLKWHYVHFFDKTKVTWRQSKLENVLFVDLLGVKIPLGPPSPFVAILSASMSFL